jgi:hypothetical protein
MPRAIVSIGEGVAKMRTRNPTDFRRHPRFHAPAKASSPKITKPLPIKSRLNNIFEGNKKSQDKNTACPRTETRDPETVQDDITIQDNSE